MSRIGNKSIIIPNTISIKITGKILTIQGPLGTLSHHLHKNIRVYQHKQSLILTNISKHKQNKSLHGLSRTLINNIIVGVTKGFIQKLKMNGIGYKASIQNNYLVLRIGYSHLINIAIPHSVIMKINNQTQILISSTSKQAIGQIATIIKKIQPLSIYKKQGISMESN
uniref:Ribosomal protein L6 n=1 Tax=Pterocladiophila hemisphaerica TaxID=2712948 RepID=A0A6M3WXN5_9FLOR|nr:ribosomal protein L6 [Pterocladiophila hemisphaerica]